MSESTCFDVVVIGGGPAGMSAVGWCDELGMNTLLIEQEDELGGQLNRIHGRVRNYLGLRAENGRELAEKFRASLRGSFSTRLRARVVAIDAGDRSIGLVDGESINYKILILATGVRRRELGIPGEIEFRGKGILESGVRDERSVEGRDVVIIGGGDAAAENALILSKRAASVTVVHRREQLGARDEFVEEINMRPNIHILFGRTATAITGEVAVSAVELKQNETVTKIPTDAVLIRIGVEPNSELVREVVELDEKGYVRVDLNGKTSREGIFAIGDVSNPVSPTISTAAGSGSSAAKAAFEAFNRLENPAKTSTKI